jgi:nitrous oxide reductase accessory protein NosL
VVNLLLFTTILWKAAEAQYYTSVFSGVAQAVLRRSPAIDPKAISTFNDYLVNGCSGANTEYPKPTSLTNAQWSSLCGRLSGDHCSLNSVKCSSSEVVFYDTRQLPGRKVQVAKGAYASGAVILTTPTGKSLGFALNRKAASAFSSYIMNGCAAPANKLYPKPSSLSNAAWAGLCGNLSGEHCAPNGVKCGKDEVLFYDATALPDRKVTIAAGLYATGEIETRY